MKNRFTALDREVMLQGADSEQWNITNQEYLPRGILTAIL